MRKEDLRIIFMGTPEFAVESLRTLVDGGYHVVAVVTQPDKPVGRHQETLRPSAVKQYALAHDIPVLQPVKMKDPDFVEELRGYHADLQVVVAFRMLPEVVWDMPRFGTFNVHAALLPQYRGAAPINWAIIHGEKETGVTTFFLDKDIDTGRIILQKKFPIPEDADVEYVHDGLMRLGAQAARETIDRMLEGDGDIESTAQADILGVPAVELKYAPKIFNETCHINWNLPAKQVHDFIRGLSPAPGAWTEINKRSGKPQVLKIFKTLKTARQTTEKAGTLLADGKHLLIACADEWLQIELLQLSGKKRMEVRDFLNGTRDINEYETASPS